MADIEFIKELLEACEEYDIAMIKTGDTEVVFNQAIDLAQANPKGPAESEIPAEPVSEYESLLGGNMPKFNNEK